jgi:hypothetical protein
MQVPTFSLVMLVVALLLSACVPDVVSLEAVPTTRFSRDLAQCRALVGDSLALGNPVKTCMKQKGYRFLKEY